MEEVPEFLAMVVYGVEKNKHLINSKVNVSQIHQLIEHINEMQNELKTKLEGLTSSNDNKDNRALLQIENQMRLKVSSLCNEYRRFKAYVDVYKQLTYK